MNFHVDKYGILISDSTQASNNYKYLQKPCLYEGNFVKVTSWVDSGEVSIVQYNDVNDEPHEVCLKTSVATEKFKIQDGLWDDIKTKASNTIKKAGQAITAIGGDIETSLNKSGYYIGSSKRNNPFIAVTKDKFTSSGKDIAKSFNMMLRDKFNLQFPTEAMAKWMMSKVVKSDAYAITFTFDTKSFSTILSFLLDQSIKIDELEDTKSLK